MFVVVFHSCFFSMVDNGCRVYKSDDQYLKDFPSMYLVLEYFDNEEDAREYCSYQPVDEYVLAEYWDR